MSITLALNRPTESEPTAIRPSAHRRTPTGFTRATGALPPLAAQPFTARLAAAGSRRTEMEALLDSAPADATLEQLRALVMDHNITGKRSAVSRSKVWQQLKEHYVLDWQAPEYRACSLALRSTTIPSDRGLLLFLMLARTDRLFRDLTLTCVSPTLSRPGSPIHTETAQAALEQLVRPVHRWTPETLVTVRQHLLSALRDFGVLQGKAKKQSARVEPGPVVTLFAARLAQMEGLSPRQTLVSVWFRLLGQDADGVWNLLHTAAGAGLLRCRRQADVVELELPPLPLLPTAVV